MKYSAEIERDMKAFYDSLSEKDRRRLPPSRPPNSDRAAPRVYAPKIPVFLVIVVGDILKHK